MSGEKGSVSAPQQLPFISLCNVAFVKVGKGVCKITYLTELVTTVLSKES